MALFSILHIWAFPYAPYLESAKTTYYPVSDPSSGISPRENEHGVKMGGFMGLKAFMDALNPWDIVKAFGRGMRWLFVGVKHRREDPSYQTKPSDLDTSYPMKPYGAGRPGVKDTDSLPVATEFHRNPFGVQPVDQVPEESAGLITHAQPNPGNLSRRPTDPYIETGQPQFYDYPNPPAGYASYDDVRGDLGAAGV
ncbi:hypothetical protein PC116_g31132, partial [Phytophthora cactorum]